MNYVLLLPAVQEKIKFPWGKKRAVRKKYCEESCIKSDSIENTVRTNK